MEDFILTPYDEIELRGHDTDAMRFAIRVALRYGAAIGHIICDSKTDGWCNEDLRADFSKLEASWYIGHGGSLNIAISPRGGAHSLYSVDRGINPYELLRYSSHDCEFNYRVVTMSERNYSKREIEILIIDIVEKRLKQLLDGIVFINHLGPCQSGVCSSLGYMRICHQIGTRWLCDDCISRFMLNEAIPQQVNESHKEQTEREKMTASLRFDILARDGFTCRICGRSPYKGDDIKLHVDHIKPIYHGGLTEPDNLQVLCDECNLGKSAKWTRQIEMLFAESATNVAAL